MSAAACTGCGGGENTTGVPGVVRGECTELLEADTTLDAGVGDRNCCC